MPPTILFAVYPPSAAGNTLILQIKMNVLTEKIHHYHYITSVYEFQDNLRNVYNCSAVVHCSDGRVLQITKV